MISIVDYSIGNMNAVSNMLRRLGLPCVVTADPEVVAHASRIILPGNGSFDACMKNLHASGLIPVLEERVIQGGVPLMGICVGAQMLGTDSAEGLEPGLGWLDMNVVRFPSQPNLRTPHMGWNIVDVMKPSHPLVKDIAVDTRFYFVHSYYMNPKHATDVIMHTNYGFKFASGIVHNNIVGVQFHPEKSHRFGKQLLSAFAKWIP
jgi:glutamine amidotransferase